MIEEEEKHKLQNDIRVLSEKLAKINESLAKKISARNEFDKTIAETESAYMKVFIKFYFFLLKINKIFFYILFQILESSQTLLNVLKRESHTLKREDDNNRYEN
jgi:sjoegren syndrome nuclear autoantigen 1